MAEPVDEVRRHRRVLALAVVAALLLVVVLVAAIALLPQLAHPSLTSGELAGEDLSTKDRLDAEHARYGLQAALRDTLLQAVGTVLAISGGVIAWLQYRAQHEARRDDTHAKLFAEALTGLRTDSLETRVGALFLLSRLAELSVAHRPACAQMMLAFVRDRRRLGPPDLPEGVPPDVQTALTLLTRHPARWYRVRRFPLDGLGLRHADLADARLDGADLTGTHLEDAALDGAHLVGADLTGTFLLDAHLLGARLDGATLDGTELLGAEVTGWVLTGARYRDVAWPADVDEQVAEVAGARPMEPGSPSRRRRRPAPAAMTGSGG